METSVGIKIELKDFEANKGTGIIKHSVYNSIDLVNDVAAKGMFDKTWSEAKASNLRQKISLLFNHNPQDKIGYVTNVYDDASGAFTEFKLFDSQKVRIGEYVDNEILTGASFGYQTIKKEYAEIKGKRVRKLLEVKHIETSLLDVQPAHPQAGLVLFNKALEETDYEDATALLQWNDEQVQNMKAYVKQLEGYCRKSRASDDTIQALQKHLLEYKQIISDYDTALTQLATEPGASDDGIALTNFINSIKLETWKKQSLSN